MQYERELKLQYRDEAELIPEGFSVTTALYRSYYRLRHHDVIFTIVVENENRKIILATERVREE